MLFQALGKIKQTTIMIAHVLIAVGVIMLLCPVEYVSSLVAVTGYIMLVLAAVMVFDFIGSRKKTSDYISFSVALVFILAGIAILVFKDDMLLVISIVYGSFLCWTEFTAHFTVSYLRAGREKMDGHYCLYWLLYRSLLALSSFLIPGGPHPVL